MCRTEGEANLRPEELTLLVERTGELAARLGYSLIADAAPRGEGKSASVLRSDLAAPYVHGEPARISCAVLVPTMRYVEPECDEALVELERRGYAVIRVRGCSCIDQARSRMATSALEQGFDETLWVDADTGFNPDDVEKLRAHRLPLVAGVCARKSPSGGLAVTPVPGTSEIWMGERGGLIEVLYAGTGFLLVRREVYLALQQRFNLPLCDKGKNHRSIPYFMPMLEDWGGQMSYLGEDYAFCRRARLCGYKIMADTSIRLGHIGPCCYGYEDAGNEVERVPTYRHVFESERRNER